jgi:CRP-like cAMP-binding protein
MKNFAEHEKLIEQYLREGNRDAAVQLLSELIVKTARDKDFEQAEALREKLFEVDSMALREIIKTGEIIETEKSQAIDEKHLETWSGLYDSLSPDEINALYYSMQSGKFSESHMLFKQGDICSQIYLIDSGRLNMFYRKAGKATLLKTLGSGDLVGEDTFFFADAVCTTSVIADTAVNCHILKKDRLAKLSVEFPGLEPKIKEYCLGLEPVAELLKAKSFERRLKDRLSLPGKVVVQMFDQNLKPVEKPFRGELLDISASGLAFIIKTTKKSAATMLGVKLNMALSFAELASALKFKRLGTVVAVNTEPFNEYIVHTEFTKNLDPLVLDELEELNESQKA